MQGKTVLLVEDEAAIVDVVRRYLERDGYRVMVASDGQRAVDEFQRLRPDLVLLDLMLPGLDGWEVCRRIRQDGSTPVIMLTARDEEADKLIGLELGADDYITKPFSPREVGARVRTAWGIASPRTAVRSLRWRLVLAMVVAAWLSVATVGFISATVTAARFDAYLRHPRGMRPMPGMPQMMAQMMGTPARQVLAGARG